MVTPKANQHLYFKVWMLHDIFSLFEFFYIPKIMKTRSSRGLKLRWHCNVERNRKHHHCVGSP